MQYIMRYHLKPTMEAAYKRWLEENSAAIRDNAPEGWTYLGTWFTVRGFGQYEVEDRWELDDYAALGAGWGDESFQQLVREWMEFGDQTRDGEVYLMKSAADVWIFE